ncbi:MAG: DNA polymerase IV [Gordonia sp. (in: high G+C Gram-positive bacteria)]
MRYRWLLHIDLDQFQVAVERRRTPELAGVTVIVGGNGDPTEARKVVTCASYEARASGVRAGMSLRTAYRKLPDATYLPLDLPAYEAASAEVMGVIGGFGPLEVWGLDEGYLGVGPLDDATPVPTDDHILALATRVRSAVADETALTCRIGISDNKQRAKMATGFAKRGVVGRDGAGREFPPGVFQLDARNWLPLMGSAPAGDLWSVGPRTAATLAEMGIDTVTDLIDAPKDDLIARFGPHRGNWLYVLCRGGGDSAITEAEWEAKSHSKSRTFATDLVTLDEIQAAAVELTDELLTQVIAEKRIAVRAAVTVRTTTFSTRTTSRKLAAPTTDRERILPVIADLLTRFDIDRPVRLLGVRLDLLPIDPPIDEEA